MKGDFSRLTFRPQQQYMRVLHQQGRPQLDADWNEQVAILLHRLETLTADLTGGSEGRSGAPSSDAGFEIGPIPSETDNFTISRGRYYVDGLICECGQNTTYAKQPLPTGVNPDGEGISLVYLDAWETVVGPLDDPVLLEPALAGMETTLRTGVVWQVKTHRLGPHHNPEAPDLRALRAESHELSDRWRAGQRGLLEVRLSGPPPVPLGGPGRGAPRGHFRGPENLLYRIEIHEGGPAGQATFKWSRQNGAVLLPLSSLNGAVAHVAPVARQAVEQLAPNAWVEFSDSKDRVLGRCRPMVQVVSADGVTGRIQLTGSPAEGLEFKHGEHSGIALRQWDQLTNPGRHGAVAGPAGLPIGEGDEDSNWLEIEDGIQIRFEPGKHPRHVYRTGDYWLIPARTADEGILLRGTAAQPPDGVEHRYAPLGLIAPKLALVIADCRSTFQPLAVLDNRLDALIDEVEYLRREIAELRRRRVVSECWFVRFFKEIGAWLRSTPIMAGSRGDHEAGAGRASAVSQSPANAGPVHLAPLDERVAYAHAAAEEAHISEALARLPESATPEQRADAVGVRPLALAAPRRAIDDLQRIRGVGPINAKRLHELGVFHFDQIAAWTRSEIRWVDTFLGFHGRIDREQWVAQAAHLAHGGMGPKDDGGSGRRDVKTGH
jgi:predicted flap endonuclease-1-like 5' DNA nuclease